MLRSSTLRSTAGTWVSYGTTIAFQILFAAEFGGSASASAFLISFAIAVAVAGVFTSTAQSVFIPRLLTPEGHLVHSAIRGLALAGVAAAAVSALLVVGAPVLAALLPAAVRGNAALMRQAGLLGLLQALAGGLSALALARGRRFIPALVPAFPSTAGALAIAFAPHIGTHALYWFLICASALELAVLGIPLGVPVSRVKSSGTVPVTLAMSTVFIALTLISPLEVVVASQWAADAGAHYTYAVRSLIVAQQLLVGGLVLSALPDWSARSDEPQRLSSAISGAAATAALLLAFAASIGLVAGRSLIALVFQHGDFTAADSSAVNGILVAALVGFAAEGLSLVLSQGLLAARENRVAVKIGMGRFGLRVALMVMFGALDGPVGVALAYSIGSALMLIVQALWMARLGLLPSVIPRFARASGRVVAGTVVAALLCVAPGLSLAPAARAAVVVCVFAVLLFSVRTTIAALSPRLGIR